MLEPAARIVVILFALRRRTSREDIELSAVMLDKLVNELWSRTNVVKDLKDVMDGVICVRWFRDPSKLLRDVKYEIVFERSSHERRTFCISSSVMLASVWWYDFACASKVTFG